MIDYGTDYPDTTPDGQVGTTWNPIDLGPYLTGQAVRPVPSIGMARLDGLRLMYPGKEHTVIGEMESGKSWYAIASVAAEITVGHHVLYVHFEETDPTDTVERLQALDVPDETILERLRFVGPSEPVDPFALAVLLDPAPSLVVLDGVNEAMSLHGMASATRTARPSSGAGWSSPAPPWARPCSAPTMWSRTGSGATAARWAASTRATGSTDR